MFKNILLPYDFENDFSAIPDYLEKSPMKIQLL